MKEEAMTATGNAPTTEDEARAAIIAAARSMTTLGINHGSAGNVSVRWHRGGSDGLLITPSALPCSACTPDDIVWLSLTRAAEGEGWVIGADRGGTHEDGIGTDAQLHGIGAGGFRG
jgi:hypothetical protein